MIKIAVLLTLILSVTSTFASETLPAGKVSGLSYRGGYVMFKVIGDSGTNYCSACPVDPGAMGAGRCWADETNKAQVGMILMARAQQTKITGRVYGFSTNCTVYQMTLED